MGKKFAEYSKFDLSEVNKEVLKKWDENPRPTVCRVFTM